MSRSISSGFDGLWTEALSRCGPDAAIYLLIGDVKFIIRCSALVGDTSLDNFLTNHVCPKTARAQTVHEIAILTASEEDRLSDRLPIKGPLSFSGPLLDGRTLSLHRPDDRTVRCSICRDANLADEEAVVVVDPDSHRCLVMVSELTREGSKIVKPGPNGYLIPFLNLLLSTYNFYLIHAAAVAHQGRSVLLLGASGAGKTTMSLALAAAGLEFMGDDLIIVKRHRDRAHSYSFWLKPKVKDPITGVQRNWEDRDWERLPLCHQARVGALAILNRGHREYRLEQCSPAAILTRLLGQGNDLRYYWDPRDWFNTASALAQHVPGFVWNVGDVSQLDPETMIRVLAAAPP